MDLTEFQKYRENKVHTDSSFPYNTYLCSIPLDFPCVPHHWHEEMELIVIQKGSGVVHVDFSRYVVEAGSIVAVLPGHLHSIEELCGEKMEYENILFRPEMLLSGSEDLCSRQFLEPLFTGKFLVEQHIHPGLSYYDQFSATIKQMDRLCDKRPQGYQLAVKGGLFQLMFLLSSHLQSERMSGTQEKTLEKLKFIVRYVQEHYQEPIAVAQMAELCHYSESHFMKFFKIHMKTSFVRYLNDYRLTMAHRMLGATSDSVLEIAEKSGFDNLSYFNRMFKKKYGVTPRQIR